MRKTFKKILAVTLTGVILASSLTGCGKSKKDDKTIKN